MKFFQAMLYLSRGKENVSMFVKNILITRKSYLLRLFEAVMVKFKHLFYFTALIFENLLKVRINKTLTQPP